MNIEQRFAAQVFNAKCQAAIARRCGTPDGSSELIIMALAELWQFAPLAANEIADHWVTWGPDGRPRPLESAFDRKIVALRR